MAKSKPVVEPTRSEKFGAVVGVDIGYGEVKGANSVHSMIMPSIIGAAPTVRYADEWTRDDGDIVTDDQGVWYIGERALMHSKTLRHIKDRERTVLPDYRRLVHVAFGRLHPHKSTSEVAHISVATGLPVAHMDDGPKLKEMLEGQHRVRTHYADGVYSVDNVAVMPQPYGTLFFQTLDEYGQLVNDELSTGKVLIVDIGRYTTNVLTVEDMAYAQRGSDSIDSGVHIIEAHIRQALDQDFHWSDPRPNIIRSIIENEKHTTLVDGVEEDLTYALDNGCADLSEQVIGLISELAGKARDIKAMILTGGGSIVLEDWIKERYPRAYLTAEPVMANAIGFSRYGRRKWARE